MPQTYEEFLKTHTQEEIDAILEGTDFVQEASQSKKSTERRNISKVLKSLDYDPNDKTIKTVDEDGKERRVEFDIIKNNNEDAYLKAILADAGININKNAAYLPGLETVMAGEKMLRKNGNKIEPLIRHELRHEYDYTYNDGSRNMSDVSKEIDKFLFKEADEFIKKHYDELCSHDRDNRELVADTIACKKTNKLKEYSDSLSCLIDSNLSIKQLMKDMPKMIDLYSESMNSILAASPKRFRDKSNSDLVEIQNKVINKMNKLSQCFKTASKIVGKLGGKISIFDKASKALANTSEMFKITSMSADRNKQFIEEYDRFAKMGFEAVKMAEYYRKSTELRIKFMKEMQPKLKEFELRKTVDPNYKHPKRIIKESLTELLENEELNFEESMLDDVTDYIYQESLQFYNIQDEDEFVQEEMFEDIGFPNLRYQLAQRLDKNQFVISAIMKPMGLNNAKFVIKDVNTNRSINVVTTNTGAVKVYEIKPDGEMVIYINNLVLSRARNKIMEILNVYATNSVAESAIDDVDIDDDSKEEDDTDIDDIDIGSDSKENNEYSEEELSALNKLISSESSAISEYFEAAKNTRKVVLSRLFTDIGDEERYHLEQLIYAKSELTGEEYKPSDPSIKREYEELLELGMDEETAMATAIDKSSLNEDDGDDSDVEELVEDISITESAISCHMQYANMLMEMMNESSDLSTNECCRCYAESYLMEFIDTVNTPTNNNLLTANPVKLLLRTFAFILKLIHSLFNKLKTFISNMQKKSNRTNDWIKKHGIFGLFEHGVYLYLYDDKNTSINVVKMILEYLDMLEAASQTICKEYRLNTSIFTDHINDALHQFNNGKLMFKRVQYSNVNTAISRINNIRMEKTKIVVTNANKDALEAMFFHYSPSKNADSKSLNLYNNLIVMLDIVSKSASECNKFLSALDNMERDTNSIYYKDRNRYNAVVKSMKQVVDGYNRLIKVITSDSNQYINVNSGLLQKTHDRDDVDYVKAHPKVNQQKTNK